MDKIKELEEKINKARKDYYNGVSTISDQLFDSWINELYILDPKNLAIIGIGADPVSNWEKYEHKNLMGSLNKSQTKEEFEDWYNKYIDENDQVLLTLKLDGLSVSLIYENGKLIKAATRGNGNIGELITRNVAKMQGVPLHLSEKINATIRGEIVLTKENHKKYFSDYSNARNGASGISRRYDGVGSEHLTVLVYELITENRNVKTYKDKFELLEKLGFKTPTYYICNSLSEIWEWKEKYSSSLRNQYIIDLDGLVAHQNNIEKHKSFGISSNRPKGSIAVKFDAMYAEAIISDVIPQVGNTGRITPVAIFNPKVKLMGAEIEKASLHNYSNINDLEIGIGAKVLICRSNDVIPFIKEVINPPKEILIAPTNCPECKEILFEKGEYLQCPNINCPAQISGRIKNFISQLNILELGDKVVEKIVQNNLVKDVSDLYLLKVEDLSNLERLGEKSAQNIINSIWKTNIVSLDVLIGSLSINMIQPASVKLVIEAGYDTLEKLQDLTFEQVSLIKGMGPVKARNFVDGLSENKDLINKLLANGLKLKAKEDTAITVGKLSGKSFVLTGTMINKRSVLEKMIKDNGGTVQSAVNLTTSYLVIADTSSNSSKAVKARSLGTTLISEDELLKMLGNK